MPAHAAGPGPPYNETPPIVLPTPSSSSFPFLLGFALVTCSYMISVSCSRLLTSLASILPERSNLQNEARAFWQMSERYVFSLSSPPLSLSLLFC